MFKKCFSCLALAPVLVVAGENGGVLERNYGVGFGYFDTQNADILLVTGQVHIPVSEYYGSTLSILGNKVNGDKNTIDSNSYGAAGSLFLRDFDLGKISMGVNYNKSSYDKYLGNSFQDTELYTYSVSGEYYIDNISLAVGRTKNEWRDDHSNLSSGFIKWYWQDNALLSLSADGMDSKDSYSITGSYQPEHFNSTTEFQFTYTDERDEESFLLSVNYYFDSAVTLKDRDRKYR